jgi:hypothetical protein
MALREQGYDLSWKCDERSKGDQCDTNYKHYGNHDWRKETHRRSQECAGFSGSTK